MIKNGVNRHQRWINTTLKFAKVKSQYEGSKHAAILVKGGKMITFGVNKDKAGIFAHKIYSKKQWHSEVDCVLSVEKPITDGAVLYIAGVNKSGDYLLSKPCSCCQEFLSQFNLKAIYYNDKKGRALSYI